MAEGNSKRQTIIMFILIILRDVSFLLSGKGNKVTESPATTIIHRVYESPYGIITTYGTPAPRSCSYSHAFSPSPAHPLTQFQSRTHLRELGVAWGITARSGKSPPNGQVAPSLSARFYLHIKRAVAPNLNCQKVLMPKVGVGGWLMLTGREGKEVAFDFLCSPAPKSMLRN